MHPTSLPGPHGCGDLGPQAYRFADFLASAGQRWWQMLPTGPVDGYGSPYSSHSAFAGSPLLVGLDRLVEDGLLARRDVTRLTGGQQDRVDFTTTARLRETRLQIAYANFTGKRRGFERFCHEQRDWLDDFALFSALREANGGKPWWKWQRGVRLRHCRAIDRARDELHAEIDFHRFVQFQFHLQWSSLKRYCNRRGIGLIGDIPIFVAHDSADVWAHRELFDLDRDGRTRVISGAAPDAFNRNGQRWGHPLYRWPRHRATNYRWWVRRFRHVLGQFDAARIDHFLGFVRYWEVPANHRTARRGRWRKGPGAELFTLLKRRLGDVAIIAEDLGLLTPEAAALRDRFGFPGMRVLHFAFQGPDAYHAPHRFVRRCVAYTGTHDNDTARGWFKHAPPDERRCALTYSRGRARSFHWDLIRLAQASVADLAITPAQDLLGLDGSARMNLPGTVRGNWMWRARPGQLNRTVAKRLREITELYGRA